MSLKTKVSLFMTILLMVSMGSLTAILCYQAHTDWDRQTFRILEEKNRGAALAMDYWLSNQRAVLQTAAAQVTESDIAYQANRVVPESPAQNILLDAAGNVLYATTTLHGESPQLDGNGEAAGERLAALVRTVEAAETGESSVVWEGRTYKAFYKKIPSAGWILVTLVPDNLFIDHKWNMIAQSASIAVLAIFVTFLGTIMLLRRYSQQLTALADVAEQVGAGNREVSFPVCREREFRALSTCLENMRNEFLHMLQESQAQTEEMHSLYQQVVASEKALHVQYEELSQKEEALRVSEKRFKLAIKASQNAIWELDLASGEFLVSPSCSEVFCLPEVKHRQDFRRLVHTEDKALCDQLWQDYISGDTSDFACEFRLKNSAGKYLWVLSRAQTVETDKASKPLRVVGAIADISELKRRSEEERYQMTHDPLTGLYNRQGFLQAFKGLVQDSLLSGYVVVIDVDDFKLINDVQGYQTGDEVLKAFARRLTALQPGEVVAGRMSDDVFLLFLPEMSEAAVQDRLKELTNCLLETSLGTLWLHASGGLAAYPQQGEDLLALLQKADLASYTAKKQGKQRFLLYEPVMQVETEYRVQLKNGLQTALKKQEMYLVYQPVYRITGGHIRIASFEALARWRSGTLGFVSPAEFIPVAEESGLIISIGEWAIREACRFIIAGFRDTGRHFTVFVNISMRQLLGADFVENVQTILREGNIPANCLGMEITESVLATDFNACVEVLNGLKALGIKISLDDFGTGYSSLTYLRHLPIDVLKLDKSFIEVLGEPEGGKGEVLAAGIIQISQQMGYQVVAEGVERLEQLRSLIGRGCDYYQGFYLSKPLPTEEALKLLDELAEKENMDFSGPWVAVQLE